MKIEKLTLWLVILMFNPFMTMKAWARTIVLKSDDNLLLRLYRRFRKGHQSSYSQFSNRCLIFYYRILLWLFLPDMRGVMLNIRKSIAFYPDLPLPGYSIFSICLFLNARMTKDIKDADLVVRWKDQSRYSLPENVVSQLEVKQTVNLRCDNITKLYVDEVFHDVFGYSTRVDPLRHMGECVKKSDYNAKHDGQVIYCPVEKVEPDFIYQLKLNNELPGTELVIDLRTYVFGDTIPFVRLTYKPREMRFGDIFVETKMVETSEVFTSEEVELILSFCHRIGLEYGQLDIIRHSDDGRLYIIDANNTPSGNSIPYFSFDRSLMAANAFYNAFFRDEKHFHSQSRQLFQCF